MKYVADDLVSVNLGANNDVVLAWGDPIEVGDTAAGWTTVRLRDFDGNPVSGKTRAPVRTQDSGVFQFSLVDVQQGDGMVVEAPNGAVMLIDGGDNPLFARYLAARFRKPSRTDPLQVDAIVVTHGDADHYSGLNQIRKSESFPDEQAHKRLFVAPQRYFHNGLVKGPSKDANGKTRKDTEFFGRTAKKDGRLYITNLVDDFLGGELPPMNTPFRRWQSTLKQWSKRVPGGLVCRRGEAGKSEDFDFLGGDIKVDVLGPIVETVGGEPALPFLFEPSEDPDGGPSTRYSASHTINGHSIVLRITCGNVRFLLCGDLNRESMGKLAAKFGPAALQAEIVKVPHHGSADFDFDALRQMNALCWLISSGDESSRKEYIHPRATLMGALGMATSRTFPPLVLCTELAAFFEMRGPSKTLDGKSKFFGFERTSFGIVHVRTDGERLLVFTHSGRKGLKEAYRFRVHQDHSATQEKVVRR